MVAQQYDGGGAAAAGVGVGVMLVWLVVAIITIAGMWKTFEKAGQPGWAAIIPIYNIYVVTQIVGKPWWWILLLIIPLVNLVVIILLYVELAKAFGKGVGFALGMTFLPFIFFPMLGFGGDQYQGAPA